MATFSTFGFMREDVFRLSVLIVFAASQSLANTWAFIHAPSEITNHAEHGIVGSVNIMTGSAIGKYANAALMHRFTVWNKQQVISNPGRIQQWLQNTQFSHQDRRRHVL